MKGSQGKREQMTSATNEKSQAKQQKPMTDAQKDGVRYDYDDSSDVR